MNIYEYEYEHEYDVLLLSYRSYPYSYLSSEKFPELIAYTGTYPLYYECRRAMIKYA